MVTKGWVQKDGYTRVVTKGRLQKGRRGDAFMLRSDLQMLVNVPRTLVFLVT